jgi:hypothetical protein
MTSGIMSITQSAIWGRNGSARRSIATYRRPGTNSTAAKAGFKAATEQGLDGTFVIGFSAHWDHTSLGLKKPKCVTVLPALASSVGVGILLPHEKTDSRGAAAHVHAEAAVSHARGCNGCGHGRRSRATPISLLVPDLSAVAPHVGIAGAEIGLAAQVRRAKVWACDSNSWARACWVC